MLRASLFIVTLLLSIGFLSAQKDSSLNLKPTANNASWAEKVKISGYMQVRYNGLFQTNENLTCDQCDNSWGGINEFSIRRMRIKFAGQLHDNVYFYIQPDLAISNGSNLHTLQIRDAYIDLSLDKKREFRFRIGQSKVPYGFENMQSSQNRLPLDRNDGINSAFKNERDLGVFFYWAPKEKREIFSSVIKNGLKGSGDYGCFALGLFNGQTANKADLNSNKHVVTRFTYPMKIGKQLIEPSLQAYTGDYTFSSSSLSKGVKVKENLTYKESRAAATFVLYPNPFGIQAEYNVGYGPQFNKTTDSIETKNLQGGYITMNYMVRIKNQLLYPFVRLQYYDGGKKHELDARSYNVKEAEIGLEWLPFKNFELLAQYTFSNRTYEDFQLQNNNQKGSLLRLQAQLNF